MATLHLPKGRNRPRLTVDYYMKLPEGPPYYELIDGDLHMWGTSMKLTKDYYFRLPEGPPYYQLVDGDLYMSPAPHFWNHQRIQANLQEEFVLYLHENRRGRIYTTPSDVVISNNDVFQPDLFYLGKEKVAQAKGKARVEVLPDIAIEILSPGTAALDLKKKRAAYQKAGVPEIWFIDSRREMIEQVSKSPTGEDYTSTFHEGDASLETPLLPGFRLSLAQVFVD